MRGGEAPKVTPPGGMYSLCMSSSLSVSQSLRRRPNSAIGSNSFTGVRIGSPPTAIVLSGKRSISSISWATSTHNRYFLFLTNRHVRRTFIKRLGNIGSRSQRQLHSYDRNKLTAKLEQNNKLKIQDFEGNIIGGELREISYNPHLYVCRKLTWKSIFFPHFPTRRSRRMEHRLVSLNDGRVVHLEFLLDAWQLAAQTGRGRGRVGRVGRALQEVLHEHRRAQTVRLKLHIFVLKTNSWRIFERRDNRLPNERWVGSAIFNRTFF